MATDVLFPHMSDEVDEGVLVTWFVEPGAHVDEGVRVASVQVEKVEEEVYAPAAGRVVELLVGQGDVARQGAVIARIGAADEEPAVGGPAVVPPAGASPPRPVPAATTPIASPATRPWHASSASTSSPYPARAPGEGSSRTTSAASRRKDTPRARRCPGPAG